ncbi:histidinol-phosphate aminotransferase [Escherichia coli]|nr:histidinol-phosphate aminotransferase [Escherichia coli]
MLMTALRWSVRQRDMMSAQLTALGSALRHPAPTSCFFDCGQPAAELAQRLLCDGVIIKPWREKGYEHWIRVSVGMNRITSSLFGA